MLLDCVFGQLELQQLELVLPHLVKSSRVVE